ncbi:hypothetical protein AA0616_2566 [Komagataeibacter nataicola NRIC 0616]|nr:hypothetical protein AA0616_2566 [Komagataeibacter nataicola NRIC 0616]
MKIAGKHRAARQHILQAARPLIGQRGFSAVGLAQILDVGTRTVIDRISAVITTEQEEGATGSRS